jgi:hypothetical protein
MSHDVKEFLDDVEKSSHVVEEAVAVVSVFRHDGFGAKSVVEEPLPVGFPTKSVASGSRGDGFESRASSKASFDVSSAFLAVMEKSLPYRSELRASRFQLQSYVKGLLHVVR